ncbi:MAG: hypothetical protein H6706_07795 [Myxococcales bacterium]|nr:hypothetical protein [Myxococcales bacterium]
MPPTPDQLALLRAALRLAAAPGRRVAGDAGLVAEGGAWVGPLMKAARKHTKPWRVGLDVAALDLLVLADDGEAARFPLAGSTWAEAATVLEETLQAHVGVELDLADAVGPGRIASLDAADRAALAAWLDAGRVAALVADEGA